MGEIEGIAAAELDYERTPRPRIAANGSHRSARSAAARWR